MVVLVVGICYPNCMYYKDFQSETKKFPSFPHDYILFRPSIKYDYMYPLDSSSLSEAGTWTENQYSFKLDII